MKAFSSLIRQEALIMARNHLFMVLAIVLAASAGSIHLVRWYDASRTAPERPAMLQAGGHRLAVEYLPASVAEPPLAERMAVALMVCEVLILGFLFGSVGLFQEKEEGSLRAYRLSPGGQARWIGAKLTLWTGLSVAYAFALLGTAALRLDGASLAGIALVTALGGCLMTALGLAISACFQNLSQWFIPGVGVLLVNMLPLAFQGATNTPVWLWLIPGWPALQAYGQLLSGAGQAAGGGVALSWLVVWLLAANCLMLPTLAWVVRRRIFKEARS